MTGDPLAALPAMQREPVHDALRSAFGTARIDAIAPMAGGASGAFAWRVHRGGRAYLLRMEGAPSPLRNPHQYEAVRIAAEAGLAPRIHHIDEAARLAIIDFVPARPLHEFPGGPRALARALGEMLQRLQATPLFPRFVDYPDIVARLFAHVCQTGLFAAGVLDPHVERLERLAIAYAGGASHLVSSHNDLIPANILFDGKRLWLIDWESAYGNDPLVDVSTLLDTVAQAPELGEALLVAWLGQRPNEETCARLDIVRRLTRLYYAGVFFSASAAANWTSAETDLSTPSPDEFRRAIGEGRLRRGAPQTKHVLGKMFLAASFLTGRRRASTPRSDYSRFWAAKAQ